MHTIDLPDAQGVLWGCHFDGRGGVQLVEGADALQLAAPSEGFCWLHLDLVDRRACRWVLEQEALAAPARELLVSRDTHPRWIAGDDFAGLVIHDFGARLEGGSRRACVPLHLIATDSIVLSGRHEPVRCTRAVRAKLRTGWRPHSPGELLELLVGEVIEASGGVAAEIQAVLDRIEDGVLHGRARDEGERSLAEVRARVVDLHRPLRALRRLFGRIEAESAERLPGCVAAAAPRISQRLMAVDDELFAIEQHARLLRDELDSRTAVRINQHLYALSLITVLFLPPTLVTGLFGMNAGGNPVTDTPRGFFVALLAVALAPAAVYGLIQALGLFRR
jgi:zinc transporter